jgi:hypothetical protein
MDILKEFARTEKQFFNWFWQTYSQPPEIFETAPFVHQCEAIWRFLGYPVNAPISWKIQDCEDYTRNVLYIYESLLIKYPDGAPNTLKELKEMSYPERRIKYPHLEAAADILHSINETIVALDKYKIKARPLPSLNDAIIMLKTIILAPIIEDTFWEDIKLKIRNHEEPPF